MTAQSKHSDHSTSQCDRDKNDFYHGQTLVLGGNTLTFDLTSRRWKNKFGASFNMSYSQNNHRGESMEPHAVQHADDWCDPFAWTKGGERKHVLRAMNLQEVAPSHADWTAN